MTAPRIGAAELAAGLVARIEDLARELLPAGQREGPHWRCGGVDGSQGQSLALNLAGAKRGIWHDFSTGEAGDALDLVAAARCGGDRRRAMDWARAWLGIERGAPLPEVTPAARQEAAKAEADDRAKKRRQALALFLQGEAAIRTSPVAAYLRGRGIDLEGLGRVPRALRYHPGAWCAEDRSKRPAMLAAVVNAKGEHVATHRTYLARDEAGRWRKAPLREPKKSLGSFAGGFIPLWRGRSGKPLAQAPAGETVAIAEGIENALSVAVEVPHLRVLAAVALGNLRRLDLPPAVRRVVLLADNDDGNPKAKALLDDAAQHFAAEGRAVAIARPPAAFKDFNDLLQAEMTP
jgi:hypothetical protein